MKVLRDDLTGSNLKVVEGNEHAAVHCVIRTNTAHILICVLELLTKQCIAVVVCTLKECELVARLFSSSNIDNSIDYSLIMVYC